MAAGDILNGAPAWAGIPPASNGAQYNVLDGNSTDPENVGVAAFDDTTIEYIDFTFVLPDHYNGSGLTLTLAWSAAGSGGNVVLSAAIRRCNAGEDLDTGHTYAFNDMTATAAPGSARELTTTDITFTDGADMDSLAAGDTYILRLRRNTGASDTLAADVYVHTVTLTETSA